LLVPTHFQVDNKVPKRWFLQTTLYDVLKISNHAKKARNGYKFWNLFKSFYNDSSTSYMFCSQTFCNGNITNSRFIGSLLNNHLILKISFQHIKYFQIFQKMPNFKRWTKAWKASVPKLHLGSFQLLQHSLQLKNN
jgi:hypothetical protein